MRVYEADVDGQVVGVQASDVDTPPPGSVQLPEAEHRLRSGPLLALLKKPPMSWLNRWVLMNELDQFIVPYDGAYHDRPCPPACAAMDVRPIRVMIGFAMTYRTNVIQQERFNSALRRYAALEDLDASHRVSRHGVLLAARRARLYHHASASGRPNLAIRHAMNVANAAAYLKQFAADPEQVKRQWRRYVTRRYIAEWLTDFM